MGDENTPFRLKEPGSGLNKNLWDSKAPKTFLWRSVMHIHFQGWTYLIRMLSVCILGTLSQAHYHGERVIDSVSHILENDPGLCPTTLLFHCAILDPNDVLQYYVEVNCEVSSSS